MCDMHGLTRTDDVSQTNARIDRVNTLLMSSLPRIASVEHWQKGYDIRIQTLEPHAHNLEQWKRDTDNTIV